MNTGQTNFPNVVRVEVHAARPEATDLRKLRHYSAQRATALAEVTWVFKVYLDQMPEPSGAGLELYVGEHRVTKYAGFPGGLFFTVNDADLKEKMAGCEVRFCKPGTKQFVGGGQRYRARSRQPA